MMGIFDKLFGKTAEEWFELGLKEKNSEKKVKYYTKALEIDPEYAAAWRHKGDALDHLKIYGDAVKCFDKALEIDPKDLAAWRHKGDTLDHLGKYEEAIRCYDQALEMDPKDAVAWMGKAGAFLQLERYGEAIRCYDQALKIDPKDTVAWMGKSTVPYLLKNASYEMRLGSITCTNKSLEIIKKGREISPEAATWYKKGNTLRHLGDYEEAVKCFDKALEIYPEDDAAWYVKGDALRHLGKYEEAIRCFDKALEIDPEDAVVWKSKGSVFNHMGKYEGAARCYDKALRSYSFDADAWYVKGDALRHLGKHGESLICYDKALEIDPSCEKAKQNEKSAMMEYFVDGLGTTCILGMSGNKGSIKELEKLTNDPDEHVRNQAKEALDIIKSSDAYEDYLKEETLNKVYKETSNFISSIELEVTKIKGSGVKIPKSEELIEHAKSKLNENNFKQANELAKEVKKVANERKAEYDLAFRSISEAGNILNETKNKNVIIPSDLLTKSKQEFEDGEYDRAKKLAEELKNLVSTKETKYREAQEELKSAESSIGKAKEFGCCNVSEAEGRLKNAEQLFRKGAYEEVIKAAKQTRELVKKIKEGSKPEVAMSLSQTSFKPNEWKRIDLAIKNIGTATAKEINVEYPKERVEIDDLIEVKELKPDGETKLRIVFRPIHTGEVPLKTKITYKDFDNKEYNEEKTFWITVGKEKPLPPEGTKPVVESGTEFFNGFIRLKMAVTNPMSQIITDVSLDLDFDENTLRLDRHEPEYPDKKGKVQLGNINPGTSKSVSFYLDPMTCAKAGTDIDCRVDYRDARGKSDSIRMESEKVEIVCPVFRTESDINIGMLKEFVENLPCHDHKVYQIPAGFETNKLIDICRETIQMHDVRHVRTFHTKDGKTCETWYYGKTKVDKSDIVIKASINEETESIEIFAATPAHKSLTGLLAELGHNLTNKIKEIGKKSTQIVNVSMENVIIQRSPNLLNFCDVNDVCSGDIIIEDSVIQESKIGGIGGGIGASSVNIKGSVLQRSQIGSTMRCPNCGEEVQAGEKFCTGCGAGLG